MFEDVYDEDGKVIYQRLTIQGFLDCLSKSKHKEGYIEFWLGEKELELERIGEFGVLPVITIGLKEYEDD